MNEKIVYIRANSSTNNKNIEQEKYVSNCNRKKYKTEKISLKKSPGPVSDNSML